MELKLQLPDDVAATLTRCAAERAMTPEALLTDLLQWHLQDEAAMEAAIAEGEADVAAGHVVGHEEVMARLDDIIAAASANRSG